VGCLSKRRVTANALLREGERFGNSSKRPSANHALLGQTMNNHPIAAFSVAVIAVACSASQDLGSGEEAIVAADLQLAPDLPEHCAGPAGRVGGGW